MGLIIRGNVLKSLRKCRVKVRTSDTPPIVAITVNRILSKQVVFDLVVVDDNAISSFIIDYGDGTTGTSNIHEYPDVRTEYEATLTAIDDQGQTSVASVLFTTSEPFPDNFWLDANALVSYGFPISNTDVFIDVEYESLTWLKANAITSSGIVMMPGGAASVGTYENPNVTVSTNTVINETDVFIDVEYESLTWLKANTITESSLLVLDDSLTANVGTYDNPNVSVSTNTVVAETDVVIDVEYESLAWLKANAITESNITVANVTATANVGTYDNPNVAINSNTIITETNVVIDVEYESLTWLKANAITESNVTVANVTATANVGTYDNPNVAINSNTIITETDVVVDVEYESLAWLKANTITESNVTVANVTVTANVGTYDNPNVAVTNEYIVTTSNVYIDATYG